MTLVHSVLWTTNAKMIGAIYLVLSLSYGIGGLLLSWLLRAELGALGEQLLFGDHQLYNVIVTSASPICPHTSPATPALVVLLASWHDIGHLRYHPHEQHIHGLKRGPFRWQSSLLSRYPRDTYITFMHVIIRVPIVPIMSNSNMHIPRNYP